MNTRPLLKRCFWCKEDPDYVHYHDHEWGVPEHDDIRLFEMLILEGAQAGLSWITILRKRAHYRSVFDGFNPDKIARYSQKKIERLLGDPGIVRNRLKVEGTVRNAKAFGKVQDAFGTFDKYIWQFVNYQPVQNNLRPNGNIPTSSKESDAMSKDLRQRGFTFVGTTICYAYMQAVGMTNDHFTNCFRYEALMHSSTSKKKKMR